MCHANPANITRNHFHVFCNLPRTFGYGAHSYQMRRDLKRALPPFRLLKTTCRRVDLSAETTIADIRAELEQSCTPFHEVHLFHGTQQLPDRGAVQVELQAVNTISSDSTDYKTDTFDVGGTVE